MEPDERMMEASHNRFLLIKLFGLLYLVDKVPCLVDDKVPSLSSLFRVNQRRQDLHEAQSITALTHIRNS